ncbi:MAG TPA: hypothetical protein VMD57_02625, partial [Candidatus Baltobacteraceae bacterium]|nr:hypothetical protein [Candidatus Baltobacteraceae bacterium]
RRIFQRRECPRTMAIRSKLGNGLTVALLGGSAVEFMRTACFTVKSNARTELVVNKMEGAVAQMDGALVKIEGAVA